jgi:uncharacterized small protein (DUF1192 family)
MPLPACFSSPSRFASSLLVASLTLGVLAACGDDATPEPSALSVEERQQLERQITELEAEVTRLQAQVSRQQQEQGQAEQENAALTTQVQTLQTQLAEARALLESQDWDGVLLRLDEARAEVERLKALLLATQGSLSLVARLVFGDRPFELDQSFTTAGGDTVRFSELRYWLTNVKLRKQDGSTVALADSYHLMDVLKEQPVEGTASPTVLPARRREQVDVSSVPAGTYTGIEFSVGVDPTHNDDLSRQAGELHVLSNMTSVSWMWFTSYIFTKTKGQYVPSAGGLADFAWETGTNPDYRTVSQTFPSPVTVNSQKQLTVRLRADVATLFSTLSPRTTATINASNAGARATLSDAFQSMFSVETVENPDR